MSDADALWLGDPTQELFASHQRVVSGGDGGNGGDGGGGIWQSDVVASRGTFPFDLGRKWGSTMCMGFILFRAKNVVLMKTFLDKMEDMVLKTEDDQVMLNIVPNNVWSSDVEDINLRPYLLR